MRQQTEIYADYNATYPATDDHLAEVMEQARGCLGNPSSTHSSGRKAKVLLESSRRVIAEALGLKERRSVVFTSGATEANNLVLTGLTSKLSRQFGKKARPHVICSEVEHPL